MKTLKQKRIQKIAFMAMGIMAIIFTVCALVDPHTALASLAIAPLVIGGITYEGKEAEMLNNVAELIRREFDKNDKGYTTDEKVAEKVKLLFKEFKIDISNDETIKKLEKALVDQGMFIKSMQENKNQIVKSFDEQYKAAIATDQFKAFMEKKVNTFDITLKTAGGLTIAGNITNVYPYSQVIPGITPIISDTPDFLNTLAIGRATSSLIIWVEMKNPDGNVVVVAEGGLKPLLDFDLDVNTATPYKYAGYMTVSKEMLSDIPFMQSMIEGELKRKVMLAANTAIGLYLTGTAAGAYSITTVKTLAPANLYDAIIAASAQIRSLNLTPTAAWVNPIDYANAKIKKTNTGAYTFNIGGVTFDAGIPIYQSNNIAVGYVLVGDFSKAKIFMYEDFNIQVGWINENLIYNLVTIVGECRVFYYVEDAYQAAFVYDAIADIKTAIEEV